MQLSVIRTSAWNFYFTHFYCRTGVASKSSEEMLFRSCINNNKALLSYFQVGYPFETCYIFVRIGEYFDCLQ